MVHCSSEHSQVSLDHKLQDPQCRHPVTYTQVPGDKVVLRENICGTLSELYVHSNESRVCIGFNDKNKYTSRPTIILFPIFLYMWIWILCTLKRDPGQN